MILSKAALVFLKIIKLERNWVANFLVVFNNFYIFFHLFWWLLSLELTRVNPDRNIFSINVELTSPFLLYRGLVRHHHRILKVKNLKCFKKSPTPLWEMSNLHQTKCVSTRAKLSFDLLLQQIILDKIWDLILLSTP